MRAGSEWTAADGRASIRANQGVPVDREPAERRAGGGAPVLAPVWTVTSGAETDAATDEPSWSDSPVRDRRLQEHDPETARDMPRPDIAPLSPLQPGSLVPRRGAGRRERGVEPPPDIAFAGVRARSPAASRGKPEGAADAQLMATSSTSNTSVEFAGIRPPPTSRGP